MSANSLIINPRQFENLEYAAYLRNPPTNTEIIQPNFVKIIEFLVGGLVLQLPHKSCAEGHVLVLNPDLMTFTCKVKDVEKDKDVGDRVTIDFYQIDKKAWAKFLDAFAARQAELNLLIKVMRDE